MGGSASGGKGDQDSLSLLPRPTLPPDRLSGSAGQRPTACVCGTAGEGGTSSPLLEKLHGARQGHPAPLLALVCVPVVRFAGSCAVFPEFHMCSTA